MNVISIRPAPPPTIDEYKAAIEAMLDAKARERRYDSSVSIATYVGSTNAAWAAEAAAFVAWRDDVWAYAYAELERVTAGQRPQPPVLDFLAELPPMAWPAAL
jgi:alkanesulfonate monooxygenase SsuD/methylene tetrahydromethanopterin reductase-like flavin-dependent oxidoreductase (luciferase family)